MPRESTGKSVEPLENAREAIFILAPHLCETDQNNWKIHASPVINSIHGYTPISLSFGLLFLKTCKKWLYCVTTIACFFPLLRQPHLPVACGGSLPKTEDALGSVSLMSLYPFSKSKACSRLSGYLSHTSTMCITLLWKMAHRWSTSMIDLLIY